MKNLEQFIEYLLMLNANFFLGFPRKCLENCKLYDTRTQNVITVFIDSYYLLVKTYSYTKLLRPGFSVVFNC